MGGPQGLQRVDLPACRHLLTVVVMDVVKGASHPRSDWIDAID